MPTAIAVTESSESAQLRTGRHQRVGELVLQTYLLDSAALITESGARRQERPPRRASPGKGDGRY